MITPVQRALLASLEDGRAHRVRVTTRGRVGLSGGAPQAYGARETTVGSLKAVGLITVTIESDKETHAGWSQYITETWATITPAGRAYLEGR